MQHGDPALINSSASVNDGRRCDSGTVRTTWRYSAFSFGQTTRTRASRISIVGVRPSSNDLVGEKSRSHDLVVWLEEELIERCDAVERRCLRLVGAPGRAPASHSR